MTDPRLKGHALDISTHAPARGATGRWKPGGARNGHFNPRSRTGSDAFVSHIFARGVISTHAPARGATTRHSRSFATLRHFNPRSRTGSDIFRQADQQTSDISTHAPRTGSDDVNFSFLNASTLISTHAPRTGSDRWIPKSPNMLSKISTHAPRTGSDKRFWFLLPAVGISTHAPRTGSDLHAGGVLCHLGDFNPRSPHGERPGTTSARHTTRIFQPTLPARGATR